MDKKILIIKASQDVCANEVEHIKTIAAMFGMEHETYELKDPKTFEDAMTGRGKYDYIYLAAHADLSGFGEADGSCVMGWHEFADALCRSGSLNPECILLLACCRGGLLKVANLLFLWCPKIDYVCGPRWTVKLMDLISIL